MTADRGVPGGLAGDVADAAGAAEAAEADTLSLSLVSHTNVGKTTLARTLLGRDIGEVRDEAHVTEAAEPHTLLETPAGERLLLWDTPGFGDSVRLARRLAQAGNPLGWVLTEVWDRWRDRPFWASQRVIRHVLGQTDVVLYLVNAAEAPEDAGYLDAELQVLALLGKPVLALLNQMGPVGSADEAALVARWQQRLQGVPLVRAVLPLDAFTRCWVQEAVLWQAVAAQLPNQLPDQRQAVFERLRAVWAQGQLQRWQQAMAELAQRLGRAALDRALVSDSGWRGRLQNLSQTLGQALGWRDEAANSATRQAMTELAARLDAEVRESTSRLIRLHGLQGEAGQAVLAQLARHYAVRQPMDEGRAALWGGLVTGALAGLKADVLSGGLTLGGGLLAGGVLGALGAAGAVRGVNRIRGLDQPQVAWDEQVLDALLANALLGYLAVAHHGRGRGTWVDLAPPQAWTEAVAVVLAEQRGATEGLWRQRAGLLGAGPGHGAGDAVLATPAARDWQAALAQHLQSLGQALLQRLYPDAAAALHWPGR